MNWMVTYLFRNKLYYNSRFNIEIFQYDIIPTVF